MRPTDLDPTRWTKFPLADWIDAHSNVRHNLAHSGMRGELRRLSPVLRSAPPATSAELRRALSRLLGVPPRRIGLTHGASEAVSVALVALARPLRARFGRAPVARIDPPEYPPLGEVARLAGFEVRAGPGPAEVAVLSDPNNPTGEAGALRRLLDSDDRPRSIVVDETVREFTGTPSAARRGERGLWCVGTFTKAYGADAIRVGFVVPPPEEERSAAEVIGLLLDDLGASSRSEAVAVLRHRKELLRETRGIFRRNLGELRSRVDGVPELSAPVWFDRGRGKLDGDRLERAALRRSILLCAGSRFGDPGGVRLCLTRRSFPEDLRAYLGVRDRFA